MLNFILTGHTCGDACWHAREDVCRCSCGGKNHGILCGTHGEQPERTSRKDGRVYKLVAVSPSYIEAVTAERNGLKDYPDADLYCWPKRLAPVIMRQATAAQDNWTEVKAVHSDSYKFLIWRLLDGQDYPRKAAKAA